MATVPEINSDIPTSVPDPRTPLHVNLHLDLPDEVGDHFRAQQADDSARIDREKAEKKAWDERLRRQYLEMADPDTLRREDNEASVGRAAADPTVQALMKVKWDEHNDAAVARQAAERDLGRDLTPGERRKHFPGEMSILDMRELNRLAQLAEKYGND